MRNKQTDKRGKLSHEVLALFFVCLAITVVLYIFLVVCGTDCRLYQCPADISLLLR